MPRVRRQIHLVAQREALLRLRREDPVYAPLVQCWGQSLQPVEREALDAYDTIVKNYIGTAPRPEKPQRAVH